MRNSQLIVAYMSDDDHLPGIVPVNIYMPLENDNWFGIATTHPLIPNFYMFCIVTRKQIRDTCNNNVSGSDGKFKPELLRYKKSDKFDFDCVLKKYSKNDDALVIDVVRISDPSEIFIKIMVYHPLELLQYLTDHSKTHLETKNYKNCICQDLNPEEKENFDQLKKKWMTKLLNKSATLLKVM